MQSTAGPETSARGPSFLRIFPSGKYRICSIHVGHQEAKSKSLETNLMISLLTVTCGDYTRPDLDIFVKLIQVNYKPFSKTQKKERNSISKGK